jgi:hypothetical protein
MTFKYNPDPATEKQKAFMDRHDIFYKKDVTKKEASLLIEEEAETWESNQADSESHWENW